MMQDIKEIPDLMSELITEVMKENKGKEGTEKVIFNKRAKELVGEIAAYSRTTDIYKNLKEQREKFWEDAKDVTPALVYGYMLDRTVNAPTTLHMYYSVVLIMPILDEVLNEGATERKGKCCK